MKAMSHELTRALRGSVRRDRVIDGVRLPEWPIEPLAVDRRRAGKHESRPPGLPAGCSGQARGTAAARRRISAWVTALAAQVAIARRSGEPRARQYWTVRHQASRDAESMQPARGTVRGVEHRRGAGRADAVVDRPDFDLAVERQP